MHVLTLKTGASVHEVIIKDGKLFFHDAPVTRMTLGETTPHEIYCNNGYYLKSSTPITKIEIREVPEE